MPEQPITDAVSSAFGPADVAALERLRLRARSLAASTHTGRRRSTARGRSIEFADYRPYSPGDDPRDLDWNAVARFDTLLIRLFHAEVALPLTIIADGSASMIWGTRVTKLTGALRLAAALGLVASENETPARVLAGKAGREPEVLNRRAAFGSFLAKLDALDGEPGRLPTMREALDTAQREGAGQTVVVLTDGYEAEALVPVLRRLRSSGAELSVIQVLHPDELAPRMSGEVTLADSESGDEVRIVADAGEIAAYRSRLLRFIAGWQRACRRIGAGHAVFTCDAAIGAAAQSALAHAGLAQRI